MRKSGAKRIVTIIMVIVTILILAVMQPAYFGVHSYFGFSPAVFIMPISLTSIVCYVLHLYQQWPLMVAWFKKSPDKKKQRDKTWRAVVLIAFILVLGYDISNGWYEFLTNEGAEILSALKYMQFWTYLAFAFLVIHVWQRWRLTFSYFRRSPAKRVP